MNKIVLTESQFNKLVNKCVKKALNEMQDTTDNIDYRSFNGTGDGYNEPYSEVLGNGDIEFAIE